MCRLAAHLSDVSTLPGDWQEALRPAPESLINPKTAMILADVASQMRAKRLFARAHPVPGAFAPRAHIYAGYLSLLRFLRLSDVQEIIEIGPGYSSVPALAVKTSVGRRLGYLGIEIDPAAASGLEIYLREVGFRDSIKIGSILDRSFMRNLLSGRVRSALCFEHSIEDILFGSVSGQRPVTRFEELAAVLPDVSDDCLKHGMSRIADMLQWIGSSFNVVLVLHHYASPSYPEGSCAQKIDLKIGEYIRDFVRRRGCAAITDIFPKKSDEEYWWIGAFEAK